MQTQEAVGKPVKSPHPHTADRPLQQGLDTGAHFRGGLVGERDREDTERRGLFRLQVPGDTVYQYPGFSAACAGKHQDIAGRGGDNLALLRIQPF